MSLDGSHLAVAVITAVVAVGAQLVTYGSTYGRLDEKVTRMEKRLDQLETRPTAGAVKKGDLCMRLLAAQENAENASFTRQMEISTQLDRMGCYEHVPAATEIDANAVEANGQGAQ